MKKNDAENPPGRACLSGFALLFRFRRLVALPVAPPGDAPLNAEHPIGEIIPFEAHHLAAFHPAEVEEGDREAVPFVLDDGEEPFESIQSEYLVTFVRRAEVLRC